jgi:hypothetical protein
MLQSVQIDRVRHAHTNNRVGAEAKMPAGRNEAAAPISEAVSVAFDGNRRVRYQIIWALQFRDAREVHVQRYNQGRCLPKFEAELATDMIRMRSPILKKQRFAVTRDLINIRVPTQASLCHPA